MGSGCTSSSNPYNCANPVSSNCVTYQGEAVPVFGVCRGDTISEVIAVIISELEGALDGTSITLSDVTADCEFISNQLAGKNKTLFNLIQILIDSSCTLKELIDDLDTQVNAAESFETKSITPTADTTQGVIQGIINKVDSLNTTVTDITGDLGTEPITTVIAEYAGNAVKNQIQSGYGVTKSGSGESASVAFSAFVPPMCPIFCVANLSNFDATGKGKVDTAFSGYYICNGLNGTPDLRGFVTGGATNLPGIQGVTLNSIVDPTTNADLTYAANIGDRKGEVKHQLSINELPTFSVSGTTDAHSHSLSGLQAAVPAGEQFQSFNAVTTGGNGIETSSETVGFTSDPIGQNYKHENRQPTYYGYFIMRLS